MWQNSSANPIAVDDDLVNEDVTEPPLVVPDGTVSVGTPRAVKAEPMEETIAHRAEEEFPLPHAAVMGPLKQFYFDILNPGMPIFDHQ